MYKDLISGSTTRGKISVIADSLNRSLCTSGTLNSCGVYSIIVNLPKKTPIELRIAQVEDPEQNKIIQDMEGKDEIAQIRWADRAYFNLFKRGGTNSADNLREGRPCMATTKDNISAVGLTIETDKGMTYQQIQTSLDIGRCRAPAPLRSVPPSGPHDLIVYSTTFRTGGRPDYYDSFNRLGNRILDVVIVLNQNQYYMMP
ncbi:hypothetical protein EVAR_19641_1 [Eumeta japonica]|uniref:Uncharacterized protein n=1 Tax=Eumeta variegata TaxID=151549 RepID=A0A4C1UFH5_EUMVA|nr:hypothetical protein EVAR_19641_1 [Eumeta japonica]